MRSRTRDLYLSISGPAGIVSFNGNQVAQWFAVVSAIAQASSIKVGQNDRWIVAESLTHGVPVWTDTAMRDLLDAISERHEVAEAGVAQRSEQLVQVQPPKTDFVNFGAAAPVGAGASQALIPELWTSAGQRSHA